MKLEDYCLPDSLPSHIPACIRRELDAAVREILESPLPIGFIWLFGSYARGDFINDHNINEDGIPTSYESDLDLMVILTGNAKKLEQIKNQLKKRFAENEAITTHIHTFYITGESLNRHLRDGQFFYYDVIKEGFPLFDSGELSLEDPQIPRIAENWKENFRLFRDSFEKALGFQQGFVWYYHARNLALASFCLHQVVENSLHAFLIVFTGYRHRSHELRFLEGQAASRLPEIQTVFPRKNPEQQARFEMLQQAYAEARYKRTFVVRRSDLEELAGPVGLLQKMVYDACQKQTQTFARGKTLPNYVPTASFMDVQTMLLVPPPPEVEVALKEKALALALTEKENARIRAEAAEQSEAKKAQQLEEAQRAFQRQKRKKEEALKREEQERLGREEALRENERLRALLKEKG